MQDCVEKQFVATARQWKLLADALVKKGLGEQVYAGQPLKTWRDELNTEKPKFIPSQFAIAVVTGAAGNWIREELGIMDLCFVIRFEVAAPMSEPRWVERQYMIHLFRPDPFRYTNGFRTTFRIHTLHAGAEDA